MFEDTIQSQSGQSYIETPNRNFIVNLSGNLDSRIAGFSSEAGADSDITNWTFEVAIRRRRYDETPLLICTTGNGRLRKRINTAEIFFDLTNENVQALGAGLCRWDLKITIPQTEEPIYPIQGTIEVQRRITS